MRRIGYTHGLMVCAMLFVVVLAVAVTPAAATDVTYSGQKIVISSPGTYVLKNDITNSDLMICIEIASSNVVFDGGGHLIDGKDSLNSAGIYVHGPSSTLTGVTVKNVRMQDWWYGVYFHKIASSKLQDSTLSSNGFTGAVVYDSAASNSITGCTVTGNDYGLVFSAGANNGVVSDNTISGNVRGMFVYLSDGLTATRNRVENNINTGIQFQVSGGGTVYNNRLNNNLNVAFTGDSFKANAWSVTPGANWSPANIIGGPKVGGNYWSRPDGTGFSQTNADADKDGFIDIALQIAEQNFDYYPLAEYHGVTPSPTPTPIVTVTQTPTPGAQTPYRSVTLPARLEAENYDLGGEGVAYHDVDTANLGNNKNLRAGDGVDLETSGGITNIGYIRSGEWVEYTVNVPATGTYPATFRVAAWDIGRKITVYVDGTQKAVANLPKTGTSYTSWGTTTVQVPLEAGSRVIKFAFSADKTNLDYVEFGTPTGVSTTPTPVVTSTVTTDPRQAAYNGPHALPGTVQAEDFDTGGQNVAYWDSTVENKAANTPGMTAYRPSEYVDAEVTEGRSNIGWIVDGEWTEYTVTVAAAGSYTATFRVGSWNNERHAVVLTVDGGTGCTIVVPNTGSSAAFQEVSAPLSLTAGTHVIRLTYQGTGQNIDWFSASGGPSPTVTTTPEVTPTANVTVTTTPETTVTATPTPTLPTDGQAPYKTFNAPCRVEAEDYDTGGENVAYHDTTAENQGQAYRLAEGVDVDAGGVTHVGYINTGEWIEYTVNVPAAGTYPTAFRVGSWYTNLGARSIAVSVDGAPKGTVTVPITGTDVAYQTVTVPLALNAGTQTIRLTFNGPRQNLDWFEIGTGTIPTTTPTVTATTTTTVQPGGQAPYNGPHAMPGRVEAEDFDYGGQNVAYWDSTIENKAANTPGMTAYRPSEYVDAEVTEGRSNIGWITAGEWTEYTVDVAAAGSYTATFRVGSWADGRQVTLTVDGAPGCTVSVPNTGSSAAFQEVSAPLSLTAGTHVIRLGFNANYQNIDWFQTAPAA